MSAWEQPPVVIAELGSGWARPRLYQNLIPRKRAHTGGGISRIPTANSEAAQA